MKRFHVHVSVDNLADSIKFYNKLFNISPTVEKADYAKWMLDDPRINFAISQRGAPVGVDHLGLQVDTGEELDAVQAQLQAADISMVSEPGTACCYAESDKHWITDPSGIAWETFHSLGSIPTFNRAAQDSEAACCATPVATSIKITPKNHCTPNSGCC